MSRQRRTLVLGGAAAALGLAVPLAAQAPRRVVMFFRVQALADAVTAGLRERGWVDGRNLALEVVSKFTLESLPQAIAEAIARKPEVIVVASPFFISAAAKLTQRIPIVGIDLESDPVAFGFARTLARPGGNITGIWLDLPELGGKNAQLLRELIPGVSVIGALWDERQGPVQLNALEATGRSAGFKVLGAPLREASDVEPAVERLKREGVKGLVVFTGGATFLNRERIVEAALKHKLPLASLFTNFPDAGGLVAYGPNVPDMFKQSAGHIDRILRGAKPAEIAIERPVRFELVINAVTAKKLGIAIPESVRLRADRVIEV
jgi:putative ABC transport system substrate-binding protein